MLPYLNAATSRDRYITAQCVTTDPSYSSDFRKLSEWSYESFNEPYFSDFDDSTDAGSDAEPSFRSPTCQDRFLKISQEHYQKEGVSWDSTRSQWQAEAIIDGEKNNSGVL